MSDGTLQHPESAGASAPSEAPGPAARTGRPAAFFDLDRTLIAGSSAFEFGRAAWRSDLISHRAMIDALIENLRFRLFGSTDSKTDDLREKMGALLEGTDQRRVHRLAPDVLTGLLPRLYPQMLEEAWSHQDAGRPIYICTAASSEVADLLAEILGFDGAVGTVPEVVDGRYTGRTIGHFTYREGKAQAMRELAEREGLDLAASYGYSDSESDLPMLRAVGHPVAVNPDRELARVAAEEGWQVMRFETIGRRLVLGGAIVTTALVGGVGAMVARKR